MWSFALASSSSSSSSTIFFPEFFNAFCRPTIRSCTRLASSLLAAAFAPADAGALRRDRALAGLASGCDEQGGGERCVLPAGRHARELVVGATGGLRFVRFMLLV